MVARYVIVAVTCLSGCAAVIPTQKDEAFTFAVEAVQEGDLEDGARAAWTFLETADEDDPRYDRGLKLLATGAEGLKLYWAASMLHREIAKARRNMELVPEALKGLERIVNTGVYDEDTLVTSFIASEEFGDLPEELHGFIDYYRGLDLARRKADDWADDCFDRIALVSSYRDRAAYVKAVRQIAEGDFFNAIATLKALKKREDLDAKLRVEVERSLARIAFEEQRFEDAIAHFETLKELAPDDPEILLEMAWTYYYLGDSRKTLGLLIALDAPVHKQYITPERFLLEALALRRLCQFGAAREAASRLEINYASPLEALARGTLPQNIPELRGAAQKKGRSKNAAKLLHRLQAELELVEDLSDDFGPELTLFLKDLYRRGEQEISIRVEERLADDVGELAEELLAAREGVRLIVHELGVSLLRGRRRPPGAKEKPAVEVPVTGERVFYPFGGEFWTDELDDLIVIAEDRCID